MNCCMDQAGFACLFNAAPDAMLVTDGSGAIVAVNPRAEALFGWSSGELCGLTIETLVPERFRRRHREKRERYHAAPRIREMGVGRGFVACRHDGSEFPAEISLSPLKAGGQDVVLVAIRDITERLAVDRRLYHERERAQVTLASIADGVITTDPAGTIDYLNPAAEGLTEWAAAEATGRPIDQVLCLVSEATESPVASPVARYLLDRSAMATEPVSLRRRSGPLLPVAYHVAPIADSLGRIAGFGIVFRDEMEQRHLARRLSHAAAHDSLTGLTNRAEFGQRLTRALERARTGVPGVLCYADLDLFKRVNDRWGHLAGDDVLRQVATLMSGIIRQRDTIARLGGDEFAALLEGCTLKEGIRIARNIQRAVREHRFTWGAESFHLGISLGVVALSPSSDPTAMLLAADGACYLSKAGGGVSVEVARLGGAVAVRA